MVAHEAKPINLKLQNMFKNLKFMGAFVLAALLLTNCNKEAKQDPTALGEITFAPLDIDPDKDYDTTFCVDGTADYARVNIDGDYYYPAVFLIDGKLKTQSIKLDPGTYTLLEFSLMDDMGTETMADDVVLKSTPMTGSPFAQYVSYSLGHDFDVVAFEKHEYWIEVLCYVPIHYEEFGFTWWEVRELTIRTQCFFGDFCIKHLPDYEGSLYALNGLQLDEVAIFKIVATHNGDPIGTFMNTYYDDQQNFVFDSPLCVEYADYDNEDDHFEFELWIYVKVGNVFQYVYFHTWEFDDDEMLPTGEDWIVEFVLGNCVYLPEGLVLPPYMNLPCDFEYSINVDGEAYDAYFSGTFAGIGPGYDIGNGTFGTWCADLEHFITPGHVYDMCAYSSLYLNLLPSSCDDFIDWSLRGDEFARVNWLFNHLDLLPARTTDQMQNAIWKLMGFNPALDATSLAIVALAMPHNNFSPLPGGWAAVLMYDLGGDCVNTQITFRVVDP